MDDTSTKNHFVHCLPLFEVSDFELLAQSSSFECMASIVQ